MTLLLLGTSIPKRISLADAYDYRAEIARKRKRRRGEDDSLVMAYYLLSEYEVKKACRL